MRRENCQFFRLLRLTTSPGSKGLEFRLVSWGLKGYACGVNMRNMQGLHGLSKCEGYPDSMLRLRNDRREAATSKT